VLGKLESKPYIILNVTKFYILPYVDLKDNYTD
jgi:hypothetical protein